MANLDDEYYTSHPDPDNPGWFQWVLRDPECYNSFLGQIIIRRGGDGFGDDIGRVRMFPERRHRNMGDVVHGGTMMGFIDCSLFAAMRVFDIGPAGPSVTLELQTHFTGAANMDEPLEAQVEVTRETGRFLFMRGLVVQGEKDADNVASFTAIVKKAPRPKNPIA